MSSISQSINRFLAAIEAPDTPAHLLDDLLKPCLADEYVLRNLFATDRENPAITNPYIGLFDVFNLPQTALLSRPRNWTDLESDFLWRHRHGDVDHHFPHKYILPIEPALRLPPGAACTVSVLEDFQEAFKVFSGGVLSGLKNWDNFGIAGGSVLASLTAARSNKLSHRELQFIYQSPEYKNSDIDLFLWGMDEVTARDKMEEIFRAVDSSAMFGAICFRTKNTITIQTEFPKRHLQIVMRLYKSPAEILCGFDVDCCCFIYNGTNVFTNPRGLASIVRQCNTIDLTRRSPSYEHRLVKYSARGYEVFYPLLERNKINYDWLTNTGRTTFPKGLGRLIVCEVMLSDYTYFPTLYEDLNQRPDSRPIPLETLRPSNYDYAWCKIPYGAKWLDPFKVMEHVMNVAHSIDVQVAHKFQHHLPLHFHVVTCGTMIDCLKGCCDNYNPETTTSFPEDLPSSLFQGPALFLTDDPGRQFIGSFNPNNLDDWEAQAYFDQVEDDDDDDDISIMNLESIHMSF